ncbi:hypothetical protein [Actinoplanes sp. L3-i22]|nr:hypothetical protein [Actinoplanes sp. L3-i22]BCY10273.1 hypothetical protein L3i22_053610 [Actinoplanes sp. L3-i22]
MTPIHHSPESRLTALIGATLQEVHILEPDGEHDDRQVFAA